jgi:hypothetical protein
MNDQDTAEDTAVEESASQGETMGDSETEATNTGSPVLANKPKGNKRFTDETIKEIRRLRALRDPETNAVLWSHAKLADKFECNAGQISQIVRNRSYKDPDYTPVNDGK